MSNYCIPKKKIEYFYLTRDNIEEFLETFKYRPFNCSIKDCEIFKSMVCINHTGFYYFNRYYVLVKNNKGRYCFEEYSEKEFNEHFIKDVNIEEQYEDMLKIYENTFKILAWFIEKFREKVRDEYKLNNDNDCFEFANKIVEGGL